jgi:oligopeptidase B
MKSVAAVLVIALAAPALADSQPPKAKKEPHVRDLGGEKFTDDYFWLRNKGTPDVESYLKAEDAYADAQLALLQPLADKLYAELISHVAEDDETVPAKNGAWLQWQRTVKGQEHPILLRRQNRPGSPEQILLDENKLAAGKEFLSLGSWSVSDDGTWLLYATDETGFRLYTLQFKDLRTGVESSEKIPNTVQALWAGDNKTVFYTLQDSAKRPYRVYRHVVGTDPATDAIVYEETDARFEVYLGRTQSRSFVVVDSESKLSNEIRLVRALAPSSAPVVVQPRADNVKYFVEHRGDQLYIQTNDTGRNFRVVTAPLASPGKASWKELRAHDDKVKIDDIAVFADDVVLSVREAGQPQLDVYDLKTSTWKRASLPEPDHTVSLSDNFEFRTHKLRYTYSSLSTPSSTYELDMDTMTSTLLKQDPVPGGFDRNNYATEWVNAKAKDGTAIPISIVYKKGTKLDGTAPLHLYAYGSYGFSIDPWFRVSALPLLDRGVVYAIAHIRGGGELGKQWHEQGRLVNKMNTFTDFIACAEHLIAHKYTSSQRLTIEGASAGGLLMGAVTNLRPDLWKAVLNKVPFVDVVNTMNDAGLPMTVTEYEEWGNPTIPEQYKWIRAYSPYDNIAAKSYPTMLVRSSYNDSQVMYWEPAKYVARMRALKTDKNPLLFKIHMDDAGHGGKSGRYEYFRDVSVDEAFLLWQDGAASP